MASRESAASAPWRLAALVGRIPSYSGQLAPQREVKWAMCEQGISSIVPIPNR